MTRDGTLAHDLFALPFPVLKINASGFPPGFLYHQAAHTELPTLSGICHGLRCRKSKVSLWLGFRLPSILVGKGEILTSVSTRHMSYMQCSSGTRSTSLSPLQMLRDHSVHPSRLVCSQPILLPRFRHCASPLLKYAAHSLTTWLAHSKKQHCDVCKHPYSFTKGSWHTPAPDHSKQRADSQCPSLRI